jgi:hypothetical protein
MREIASEAGLLKNSPSRAREGEISCPFCGASCSLSGIHEQVRFFLVRVEEQDAPEHFKEDDVDCKANLTDYPAGDANPQPQTLDGYMRTSSILRLRTKPKYPWRLTDDGEKDPPEPCATEAD